MAETKVVLSEKLASFEQTWSPKIVAELNGQLQFDGVGPVFGGGEQVGVARQLVGPNRALR